MSPGGSAKGGALCACGVITQGRSSLGPGREPRRERPRRITDRPSAFQAGHNPSCRATGMRLAVSPVADACRWPLLLLLLLLSVTVGGTDARQLPGTGVRMREPREEILEEALDGVIQD